MTVASARVSVFFGLTADGGDFLTVGDPVKGLIESATYVIAGDTGSDVTADAFRLSVRRGRNRELDEFDTGMCSVSLWNMARTYDDTNAASPLAGLVTPGKRVVATIWGQTVFAGMVEDWDNEWLVDGPATTTLSAVDGLGELAVREFDAWTTTAGETAGVRLASALNRDEVAYNVAGRDFDAGFTSLQADNVTWGSNVLNYCQLVAKSDAGRFFATRENVLRYQDRHSLVNPTSAVVFRDDKTGTDFHGVSTSGGSDLLFNRVGVDREGGILQTVEDTEPNRRRLGVRTLSLTGLLMDNDSDAEALASWLLGLYGTPATRISSVTVKVNALAPSDRGLVTALDIGDVVTVVWTPAGVGAPLTQQLVIEGVEHDVEAGVHVMTLHTSLASQLAVFVIEDATLGLIGTGGVIGF